MYPLNPLYGCFAASDAPDELLSATLLILYICYLYMYLVYVGPGDNRVIFSIAKSCFGFAKSCCIVLWFSHSEDNSKKPEPLLARPDRGQSRVAPVRFSAAQFAHECPLDSLSKVLNSLKSLLSSSQFAHEWPQFARPPPNSLTSRAVKR